METLSLSYIFRLCWIVCLAIISAFTGQPAEAEEPRGAVFENIRILTMSEVDDITSGYVAIERGQIVAFGEGGAPAGLQGIRIDGSGATLMPGLTDMHVHYWEASVGPVYPANSITRVRNLTGATYATDLDLLASTGVIIGPRVHTTGPLIDGADPVRASISVSVENAEQARGAVNSQAASGYRAVKLYSRLTPASFRSAAEAAKAAGLAIYCHVPDAMTVRDVLSIGVDSIEHMDGYAAAMLAENESVSAAASEAELWANADPSKFSALAEETAAAGTALVPTFALIYGRVASADADAYFARPEAAYLPSWSRYWRSSVESYDERRAFFEAQMENKIAFARAARDAGVTLLIGTDGPNPFVTPGWSIHDEIEAFSKIGYTNREILELATTGAADFLGEAGKSGVIAEGARADLVLLPSNPVDDLSVLRKPLGVMINGHWYDRTAIDTALAERAAQMAER